MPPSHLPILIRRARIMEETLHPARRCRYPGCSYMIELLEDRSLAWADVQPLSSADALIDQVMHWLYRSKVEKIAVVGRHRFCDKRFTSKLTSTRRTQK
jgi:hypothetical protein